MMRLRVVSWNRYCSDPREFVDPAEQGEFWTSGMPREPDGVPDSDEFDFGQVENICFLKSMAPGESGLLASERSR